MGNFTKKVTKKYEFDGDTISVTMTRMKRKHALKFAPHMKMDDEGNMVLTFEDQMELVDAGAGILRENLRTINGLFIDGEEVKVDNEELMEALFTEAYFTQLVSEMMADLIYSSFVVGGEREEVKKPHQGPSEDIAEETQETSSSEDGSSQSG